MTQEMADDNRTYVELKLLFNADGAKYFDK